MNPVKLLLGSNGLKLILLVALSVALVSCETVNYYSQAARGQLAIVLAREDIQRLLVSSENLPAELRSKFATVLEIREFAENELLLPVGDNYLSYVDVEREHVVWNVFAAAEFSVDPVNWCYPIAGCVAYRGYFSEIAAENFAADMEADGFDVYTGGVDAYSTLGWFKDSLLSTVMSRADYQLAGLIFHELAHQLAYVPGDTTFNESFATAVEREGIRRWLERSNQSDTIAMAQENAQRQQNFTELVIRYRDRFDSLYQRELPLADMRNQKEDLQQQLLDAYAQMKQGWGGYSGYDNWFAHSLNNAQLSTVGSYNDLVPFFDKLLRSEGGNLAGFYDEVKTLAGLDDVEREALTTAEAP